MKLSDIQAWIDNQAPREYGALPEGAFNPQGLLRAGREEAPISVRTAQTGQYFTPVLGDILDIGEGVGHFMGDNPNYALGTGLLAAGAVGLIPGVGDAASAGIKKLVRGGGGLLDDAADVGRRFVDDQRGAVKLGGLLDDVPQPRLIAHHNLGQENLQFADELGGLPYPSIAVSRADAPLNKFGDISLLGGRDMATPSRSNVVWPGDGYSVRQPRGDIGLVDRDAFGQAFGADPRFSHLKDKGYWWDMYDDVGRADSALRDVEVAINRGAINPTDYERWDDLHRAARKELGFSTIDTAAEGARGVAQFGDTERTLWRGYTPSGNRRKPAPYTLDNVMADMGKSAREAGAESFNYGPASFRANANPPFRSFDDVSDARSRILPEQETTDIFDAFGARYNRVASEVADLTDITIDDANQAFDFVATLPRTEG